MKTYEPSQIRNVALVGHGHTGKTSLVSALLYHAGAVTRLGKVDDGTAPTDFEPEEIDKKISMGCTPAFLDWKRTKVNLLDTPGYGAFISDAKAGLRVADGALLLVDAVSGVEVQTESVWRFAEEYGVPLMVVVNRIDRENSSHDRALESLQKAFGRQIVPIQIPLGEEKSFSGVADLVSLKALKYDRSSDDGKSTSEDLPADLKDEATEARKSLMEMVAEGDDALMERYLENEDLTPEEFAQGLKRAVATRQLFPVVYTSAALNFGSDALLDTLVSLLPSPADAAPMRGKDPSSGEERELKPSLDEPFTGFVFKTVADPFAGKITLMRVYSGKLGTGSLYNATQETSERFTQLAFMLGKTQTAAEEAHAGDIVAIPKLKETLTNDTLCAKDSPVVLDPIVFPEPAVSFAIQPKTHGDEEKIGSALHRLAEADPTLRVGRDAQTGELLVSGMGENHIEVVVGRLKNKFGVEVSLKPPKVPYRETIKRKVEISARHKKQTGGRGQFADVTIKMEPLARGEDFAFEDKIFGGSIPNNLRPAVEKGIQEARVKGFLAGCPVVDFKVILTDGGFHPVDSSEMAFKIAGGQAFKKGMAEAGAVLLEPIMQVRVDAPEDNMGDIIGDMNSRRGRIQGMEAGRVDAQVPMAEMLSFSPSLKSITGGRGSYHMEFSHYDEVPAQVAQKIIEDANKGKTDEED